MSKGRYHSKKNNKKLIWLIAVLAVVLVVLFAYAWSMGGEQPDQTEPNIDETGEISNFGEIDWETETGENGEAQETQQNQQGQSQGGNQSGDQSTEPPTETTVPIDVEIVTQPPVEIIQQADADYERWLAATMLISISMEYPDFEITGIYLASETTLEGKMDSKGCYILFNSFGELMAVHSVPLEGERTAAGTKDISSQTLGFATFDVVDPSTVDTASMIQVSMDELGELISQSMLVSIYSH